MILEWLIKRREVTVDDDDANESASVELSVRSDAEKEELVLTESNAWLHGSAALSALPAKDAALTLTLYDKASATLSTFSGTLAADGTVTLAAADSGKIVCDKSGCTTVDEVDIEVRSAEVFESGKGYALTVDLAGADTYEVAYATIGVTGGEKAEVDWDAVGSIWEAESTLDHAGVIVVKATSRDAGGKTLANVKSELAEPWIDDREGVNALSAGAGTSVAVSRDRAFGAGKYALELDSINACWITSVVSDGWTATSYPTHATLEVGGDSTTVPANSYQRSTTLLKIGDEVEATVLSIDRDEGRMGITSGKLLPRHDGRSQPRRLWRRRVGHRRHQRQRAARRRRGVRRRRLRWRLGAAGCRVLPADWGLHRRRAPGRIAHQAQGRVLSGTGRAGVFGPRIRVDTIQRPPLPQHLRGPPRVEDRVALAQDRQGRLRTAVVVARVDDRVLRERRETLAERAAHLGGVAAREVGATTTLEEERVPGHQRAVHPETAAPRRVAGRVHPLDLDGAGGHLVPAVAQGELAGREARHLLHELGVAAVDVHRAGAALQQAGEPFHVEPHHRTADVVGVVMRAEGAHDLHLVGLGNVHDVVDGPGGVDDHALPALGVAHEVHEVGHLTAHGVLLAEVPAGQQLAEVQAIAHGVNPSSVR